MDLRTHLDGGSLLVMAITLALFVAAVFATGLTHDLLLEAGVFLVSVKLILMAYKSSVATASIEKKLDGIHAALERVERAGTGGDGSREGARRAPAPGERIEPRDYEPRKPLP